MCTTLEELYRSINREVKTIYVFPNIHRFSQYNPYLKILYSPFLKKNSAQTIQCKSPHPLLPFFIIKRLFGEASILHYHWLEFYDLRSFWVMLWKFVLVSLFKLAGGHIVWTVHNKVLHSKRYFGVNLRTQKLLARLASRLHVHSKEAQQIMAPILQVPKSKFTIIQHPLYPVTCIDYDQARTYLVTRLFPGLKDNKPIFLMYGYISKYKGILEVIPHISENLGQLIIAGDGKQHDEDYLQEIKCTVKNRKNIFLLNRFIDKSEEPHLFCAADGIIFNFTDTISSGSVMLGLSYKRDIIIPNLPVLKELDNGRIWRFNTLADISHYLKIIVQKGSHGDKSGT